MSLLFPAYLAGLLGLALPWLLHRFSDQQAPEQVFPSGRFLEATTPPVSRTRQLKYLGLLLLRVLSLLLLCFLFAQPWLDRQSSDTLVNRHHVIAVDQSLSMRASDRWPAAISRAREIVAGLPSGDSVELLGVGAGISRFGAAGELPAAQLQALSASEPGYGSSDYGTLMQGINRIATEADSPVKLWMISDSQQSALPAQLNALYAPQVAELAFESVVTEAQRNIHLAANALSSDGVNVQVNVQLMASDSRPPGADDRAGAASSDMATVQLFSGDSLLAEQQAALLPGELQTLIFDRLVMPASSNPVFTVALLDDDDTVDDLPDDNRVDIVVKTANPMPVTLLATDRNVSGNAAVFLATALETDDLAQVEIITGSAERVPADVQHIMTGRLLSGQIDPDILDFIDSGANALVFSSASADLTPGAEQLGVASVRGVEMGVADDSHPLELGKLDWAGTRFYNVPPLVIAEGDRVLLQTTDQQVVLVEKATPRGRLLVLNDRLDGVNSNLPLQPAFVALMQSILGYFDASTAFPDQILAGSRLALPARVQVLDPDDQPLLTLGASGRSGNIELDEPGLYKIVGVRGEHVLQVVLDAREADIGTMSEAELVAWQSRYQTNGIAARADSAEGNGEGNPADNIAGNDIGNNAVNDNAVNSNAGNTNGRPETRQTPSVADAAQLAVWRFILPALLLIFIMESALANRRLDVRRDGT